MQLWQVTLGLVKLNGKVRRRQSLKAVSPAVAFNASFLSPSSHGHLWFDGAVQSNISHDSDTGSTTDPVYSTTFDYDDQGRLNGATIGDYLYRDVSFTNDENGQIIRRDEGTATGNTGSPHEVWYRFNGRQLGYTGNNGTSDVSTDTSIAERTAESSATQGIFRNNATAGTSYADFIQSYDPLNSYNQGSGSGSYTELR